MKPPAPPSWRPPRDWHSAALFGGLLAFIGLFVAETFVYERAAERAHDEQSRWLGAVASGQASRVSAWLDSSLADADILRATPRLPVLAERFIRTGDASDRSALLRLMSTYQLKGYCCAELLAPSGAVRLRVGRGEPHDNAMVAGLVRKALVGGRPQRSLLYRHGRPATAYIDLYAPLARAAVIRLVSNLDQRIGPILRDWPRRTDTGQSYLVRLETGELLYLSPSPRKPAAPPAHLRTGWDLASLGEQGSVSGSDYRGTPVIASMARIAGTDWALVASIDRQEALALQRAQIRPNLLPLAALAGGSLLLLAGLWRKHRAEPELRVRQLLAAASAAGAVFGPKGETLYLNPAFTALFGWDKTDVPSLESWWPLAAPERAPELSARVSDLLERARRTGQQPPTLELAARGRDGARLYAALHFSVIGDRTLLLIIDHSRRKRLEEEKAKADARLLQAQKMEALGRLAGGVAHDFNNMISVVLGFSGMILDEAPQKSPLRDYAQQICATAKKAGSLAHKLLALSRSQPVQAAPFDPNAALEALAPMIQRLVGERIAVEVSLAADAGDILMDPVQFDQAILNLCANARDAMPQGGTLAVATRRVSLGPPEAAGRGLPPGEHVLISVSDTGGGIPQELQSRLFEPYFTNKPDGAGTGLGLSVVLSVVEQNRGRVSFSSSPGAGTTFQLYFPRLKDKTPRPEPPPVETPRGRGENVLVVEDDEQVRLVLGVVLRHGGYAPKLAATAREALELWRRREGPFSLLLIDVILPDMSGPELGQRLRREDPGLPVIYCSGYAEDRVARGIEPGAGIELIAKPLEKDQLLARIRRLIDAAGARPAPLSYSI